MVGRKARRCPTILPWDVMASMPRPPSSLGDLKLLWVPGFPMTNKNSPSFQRVCFGLVYEREVERGRLIPVLFLNALHLLQGCLIHWQERQPHLKSQVHFFVTDSQNS